MPRVMLFVALLFLLVSSCNSGKKEEEVVAEPETTTPVTITSIIINPIKDYEELNATSTFFQKTFVKANINGYVSAVNTNLWQLVNSSQVLFVLKTKEAESIGNTINSLDSSFRFSGIVRIKANKNGYITELNHQPGDFVQEGEQLAVISDAASFAFVMNAPYELRPYLSKNRFVEIQLPDGRKLNGEIAASLPLVDSASQTLNVIIHVNDKSIPANLIGKVRIVKSSKDSAMTLPRQAVLSDETQANFWVMRLLNDSMAVKVNVNLGMQLDNEVEILSPSFDKNERFLLTGNFGLPDTARISIQPNK